VAAPNTVDGRTLLSADITEPEIGAWRAEVTADHNAALSGRVVINLDGEEWLGTVGRSSVEAGRVNALIVGGAGALATDDTTAVLLDAKSYRGASLGTVLADLLTATGETLATASVGLLSAIQVPTWSRAAGPAKRAMEAMATKAGVSWRIQRDGLLWIGIDQWPASGGSPILTEADSARGLYLLRDGILVQPGTTYDGEHIRQVVHHLDSGKTVTEAWTQAPTAVFDRQREMVRREVDQAQLWPARVVSQRADSTLEIIPDDANIRGTGIDGAIICPGLPGLHVEVPSGSRALLAFAGGDPSRPRVVAWDHETLVTLLRVGTAVADFVALAGKVLTELQDVKSEFDLLKTAYNAHVHPSGVGPTGTTTPYSVTYSPSSVACTLLKTE